MFSLLDAAGVFYQIPLDRYDTIWEVFFPPPESFQRVVNNLLHDHEQSSSRREGTAGFKDYIIIHSETLELLEQCLQRVLTTLKPAGLKLNEEKCLLKVSPSWPTYLMKHVITPDQRKVESIKNIQPLQNTTELKSMLSIVHCLACYLTWQKCHVHLATY